MKHTQEKIIIALGVWLIVLPFTGFPRTFKTVLTVITGVVIIYIGALIYKRVQMLYSEDVVSEIHTGTFTETL